MVLLDSTRLQQMQKFERRDGGLVETVSRDRPLRPLISGWRGLPRGSALLGGIKPTRSINKTTQNAAAAITRTTNL
jgi:hypothetical protein